MRVIARSGLQAFWQRPGCEDSEQPLRAWIAEVRAADWRGPADIRARYRSAGFESDNRVAFNITGGKYRLVVQVNYEARVVLVEFVGSHAEYSGAHVSAVCGGGRE